MDCLVGAQSGAAGRQKLARKGLRGQVRAFLSFSVVAERTGFRMLEVSPMSWREFVPYVLASQPEGLMDPVPAVPHGGATGRQRAPVNSLPGSLERV
jgi:hypothetical protein